MCPWSIAGVPLNQALHGFLIRVLEGHFLGEGSSSTVAASAAVGGASNKTVAKEGDKGDKGKKVLKQSKLKWRELFDRSVALPVEWNSSFDVWLFWSYNWALWQIYGFFDNSKELFWSFKTQASVFRAKCRSKVSQESRSVFCRWIWQKTEFNKSYKNHAQDHYIWPQANAFGRVHDSCNDS